MIWRYVTLVIILIPKVFVDLAGIGDQIQ